MYEIRSKLTIKTPEWRLSVWCFYCIVNFEQISNIVPVFQLLTVNKNFTHFHWNRCPKNVPKIKNATFLQLMFASNKKFHEIVHIFSSNILFDSKYRNRIFSFNSSLNSTKKRFQRRIHDPAKHLRRGVFQEKLTPESRSLSSHNAPSFMFDKSLNMPLGLAPK